MTRKELETEYCMCALSAYDTGRMGADERLGELNLSAVETVAKERKFRYWSYRLKTEMKDEAVLKLYRTTLKKFSLERDANPWKFVTIAIRKSFLTTARRWCTQKERYERYMAETFAEHPELLNDVDAKMYIESLLKPPLMEEPWEE